MPRTKTVARLTWTALKALQEQQGCRRPKAMEESSANQVSSQLSDADSEASLAETEDLHVIDCDEAARDNAGAGSGDAAQATSKRSGGATQESNNGTNQKATTVPSAPKNPSNTTYKQALRAQGARHQRSRRSQSRREGQSRSQDKV